MYRIFLGHLCHICWWTKLDFRRFSYKVYLSFFVLLNLFRDPMFSHQLDHHCMRDHTQSICILQVFMFVESNKWLLHFSSHGFYYGEVFLPWLKLVGFHPIRRGLVRMTLYCSCFQHMDWQFYMHFSTQNT